MAARPASVYRSANFRKLWFSQVISKAGSNLTEIALAVFAFNVSGGKPLAYATVLALSTMPPVLLGWMAGAFVDRWDRRRTMVVGDAVRAVLVASIPFVGHLWWAYLAVFLSQTIGLLYTPNQRALLPEMVGESRLTAANAALNAGTSAVDIPAYLLGIGLLARIGLKPTFLGDGLSYAVAAAALLTLALPANRVPDTELPHASDFWARFRAELKGGLDYYRGHALVQKFLWLGIAGAVGVEGLNVLTATLMRTLLHRPEANLGWLLAAQAGGILLGSTLIGDRLQKRRFYPWVIGLGFLLLGLSDGGLAAGHLIVMDAGFSIVAGVGAAMVNAPTRGWLLAVVPAQVRGRVFVARGIGLGLASVVSVLGAGIVAEGLGVATALIALGVVLVATAIMTLSTLIPEARREGAPEAAQMLVE
jgi:MFS family permease